MTIELGFLLATAVLLTVLWIPYILGIVKGGGELTTETYKTLKHPDGLDYWVYRANRAHLNLVEQFGPFSAVIIVAHLNDVSTTATAIAAIVFFVARVIHAVVMIGGYSIMRARTNSFTVAFVSILVIVFEILRVSLA